MRSDVAIVGGGPAALAAAVAFADRGLRVVVLAGPDVAWVPGYGGWLDELREVGLEAFADPVWPEAEVVFGEGDVHATGRAYARVARRRLRASLLDRCDAQQVVVRWARALAVTHEVSGSVVRADDGSEVSAALVVDASGHQPVFVRRAGEPTAFQAAVGVTLDVDAHPWTPGRATFMDLRTGHVDDELGPAAPTFLYALPRDGRRVFVEGTSLVRAPAVPFDTLLRRLERRLAGLGLATGPLQPEERCLIPMDTPLPDLDQRVVGFGGAASMVHPATGYLLARVFGTAPHLAERVATDLGAGRAPGHAARRAWRVIWTRDDRLRRELHLFGSRLLASMDAEEQRRFFSVFFSVSRETWSGYLAGRGDTASVLRAMSSMLAHGNNRIRWTLLRAGARLPGVLLRAQVQGWETRA